MIAYPGLVKNYVSYFDSPTRRNYLNLGLTLITLIILLLLIYPAVIYILDLNQTLAKNRAVEQLLVSKITSLQAARNTLETLSSSLNNIDQALPNQVQVGDYLNNLEVKLGEAQASITSLQFDETQLSSGPTTQGSQIMTATYSITLSGNYENLKSALSKIEDFARYTDITGASFTSNKDDTSGLKLVLKAKTYFYGAPLTSEKAAATSP